MAKIGSELFQVSVALQAVTKTETRLSLRPNFRLEFLTLISGKHMFVYLMGTLLWNSNA